MRNRQFVFLLRSSFPSFSLRNVVVLALQFTWAVKATLDVSVYSIGRGVTPIQQYRVMCLDVNTASFRGGQKIQAHEAPREMVFHEKAHRRRNLFELTIDMGGDMHNDQVCYETGWYWDLVLLVWDGIYGVRCLWDGKPFAVTMVTTAYLWGMVGKCLFF